MRVATIPLACHQAPEMSRLPPRSARFSATSANQHRPGPRKGGRFRCYGAVRHSLANEWIEMAAQQLADGNMSERPESIAVTIHGWERDLHPGDNDTTVSDEFASFINGRTREEINRVTVSKQRRMLIGALTIVAASAVTFGFRAFSQLFDLIFGGAAILLCASALLWLLRAYREPARTQGVCADTRRGAKGGRR